MKKAEIHTNKGILKINFFEEKLNNYSPSDKSGCVFVQRSIKIVNELNNEIYKSTHLYETLINISIFEI